MTVLGGTMVSEGATTIHETKVIGTYIQGKYAQILESTSRVIQPSPAQIAPSPTFTAASVRTASTATPALQVSVKKTFVKNICSSWPKNKSFIHNSETLCFDMWMIVVSWERKTWTEHFRWKFEISFDHSVSWWRICLLYVIVFNVLWMCRYLWIYLGEIIIVCEFTCFMLRHCHIDGKDLRSIHLWIVRK